MVMVIMRTVDLVIVKCHQYPEGKNDRLESDNNQLIV